MLVIQLHKTLLTLKDSWYNGQKDNKLIITAHLKKSRGYSYHKIPWENRRRESNEKGVVKKEL